MVKQRLLRTMLLLVTMTIWAAMPQSDGLTSFTLPRRSMSPGMLRNHAKSHLAPLFLTMPPDHYGVDVFSAASLEKSTTDFPSVVFSLIMAVKFPISADMVSDPLVAAEVFADAAHIVMDFASFVAPATVVLRLAVVVGRILTIASDYIPDHAMFPEEFIFQFSMLLISLTLLTKSVLPLAMSSSTKLSFQDRRTYCVLFGPAGVSWHQYKTLATMALEWITIEPGHTIESDNNFMYWLYSGEAVVLNSYGKVVNSVSRVKGAMSAANATSCLIGEAKFIQTLETTKFKHAEGEQTKFTAIVKAGPSGAELLRINTDELSFLMEHDEHLAKAIRRLLIKCMHDKLCSLLNG